MDTAPDATYRYIITSRQRGDIYRSARTLGTQREALHAVSSCLVAPGAPGHAAALRDARTAVDAVDETEGLSYTLSRSDTVVTITRVHVTDLTPTSLAELLDIDM